MYTDVIPVTKSSLAAILMCLAIAVQSQSGVEEFKALFEPVEPIPVVYLGSYHMGNPGADMFNLEADDVLAPKRQQEIQEVVEMLARFNPTKVAVEAPRGDSATIARYKAYLAGERDLRKSEEEQIGFRLAKMLGHETIYPIDVRLMMNSEAIGSVVGSNPQKFSKYLATLEPAGQAAMKIMGKWLSEGTIRDMLYNMNDPDIEYLAHELYFRSFIPIVQDDNYVGADMVNSWYHRNLRIFSNLHQISDRPDDRIIVVYGQGHVPLLKQFTRDSPYFEVEDVQKYLKG